MLAPSTMSQHALPEASVLGYKDATVLGSGTFGVVIGALPCHARSENARADRVAVKLMPVLQLNDDFEERLREIAAMDALKESGDIGNVVVAKRVFLHKECKHELEQFHTDAARSDVAQAQFISRALSTLRVKGWRDLIAIEMDIAQGSVRNFLKIWGQNFGETPARFAYTPDNIADQWLLDSSKGVRALHACGIGHRDMKPDNLLVYFHGARLPLVKVSDFGLAAPIASMKTKVVCTPLYRPPEVLEGGDSYNESVDIWSMGCIYAELLSGLPLFLAASDIAILQAIRKMFPDPSYEHCAESMSDSSLGGADAARSEVARACNADPKVVRGVDQTHPLARILATHACESQVNTAFRLLRIVPGERPSAERCVAMFEELVDKSIGDGRTERSEVARSTASGQVCKNEPVSKRFARLIAVSQAPQAPPRRNLPWDRIGGSELIAASLVTPIGEAQAGVSPVASTVPTHAFSTRVNPAKRGERVTAQPLKRRRLRGKAPAHTIWRGAQSVRAAHRKKSAGQARTERGSLSVQGQQAAENVQPSKRQNNIPNGSVCACVGKCKSPEHYCKRSNSKHCRGCTQSPAYAALIRRGPNSGVTSFYCKYCICSVCKAAPRRDSEYCSSCYAIQRGMRPHSGARSPAQPAGSTAASKRNAREHVVGRACKQRRPESNGACPALNITAAKCKCSGHCAAKEHNNRKGGGDRSCSHPPVVDSVVGGGKKPGDAISLCQYCVCKQCGRAPRRESEYCTPCHVQIHGKTVAHLRLERAGGSPAQGGPPSCKTSAMPGQVAQLPDEFRLVWLARHSLSDLVPCDLQAYFRVAFKRCLVEDLALLCLKEPWAARELASNLKPTFEESPARRSTHADISACRVAIVKTIRRFKGVDSSALSATAKRERQQRHRQRGLLWLGFKTMVVQWGFLVPCGLSKGRSEAAPPPATIKLLGEQYTLDPKPAAFHEFMAAVVDFEKAEGYPDCICTPEDAIKFCCALHAFLESHIPSKDYNAPHVARKVLLRLELEMRNQGRSEDARPSKCPALLAEQTAWDSYWARTPLESLKHLMPDQKQFLEAFDSKTSAGALSKLFGGEHVFLLSAWACLMADAYREFGRVKCFQLFSDRAGLQAYIKRDQELHGRETPPCFRTIVREYCKVKDREAKS